MKTILTTLACATVLILSAQRPALQTFTSSKGNIDIQPLVHASMVITWNKQVIYVDPYGGGKLYEGLAAPDLVLITDIHPDHLNIETLDAIDVSKAKIIAPQAVIDKLPEAYKSKAVLLANNQDRKEGEITIHALAMYNLPEAADAMHTKGRGNGYVLEMGGKRIYISGDTEDIAEMRALKNIDVAFVCMNLPYTMDVEQAASAVLEFQPKVVYAFHYRGKDGFADTEKFKKLVNEKNKKIEVRLLNWYPTP
jgi:L-ascorbate metabolism protein UlaG (beta-lactamase superfamily)